MINYCFPTFYHEIDLNQELERRKIDLLELQKACYEIKEIYPVSDNKSGMESYQSPDLDEELVPEIIKNTVFLIRDLVQDLYAEDHINKLALTNCWLNINPKGSFNVRHVHPRCAYSGVFYIKTTKEHPPINLYRNETDYLLLNSLGHFKDDEKSLVHKPHLVSNIKVIPRQGNCLIFPFYLPHEVDKNEIDIDRISLSFNFIKTNETSI
tara:strand:- start:636 stop:1265 length:630 start_codon:yes stop_codon:yes gene_type:complete